VPPPEARALSVAALVLASGLIALTPAYSEETPEQKLQAVQRQVEQSRARQKGLARQAEALALELARLRADGLRAAEAVQAREATLSTLEAQLQSLVDDETQKRAMIARDRDREAELLAALARLALYPPEALALGPLEPEDAVRTAILLGETAPRLQSEAQSLSLQLGELRRLRQEIERKRQAGDLERQGLEKDRQRLDGLIQRKAALRDRAFQGAEQGKQRMTKLGAEAGDLHDLIQRLEAERRTREENGKHDADRPAQSAAIPRPDDTARAAPPPSGIDAGRPRTIRPFDMARGAMVYPARGTLALRYGEADEFGASTKGLTLVTRPGAIVVAPYDGRVEFAGPFKGYGQILIIQHGDGYHSLLAGLDRIDGAVGDWLAAGEPVGAMSTGEPKPRLYLELRHNGQPINPLPWLATRDEKVSG
jgi:septal ring factor EnvC (AmiA/AmiB activator)